MVPQEDLKDFHCERLGVAGRETAAVGEDQSCVMKLHVVNKLVNQMLDISLT